jgi:hypothetical protein
MSHDHAYNQHGGRPTWIRSGIEIILLILIGLMFFILAYQALTERGRGHAVKCGRTLTSGERTKLLLNIR